MSKDIRSKIPIPSGYRIYYGIDVAGVGRNVDTFEKVLSKGTVTFELMPEPDNPYDKNAIMVQAKWKGFFGTKTALLGYVPKEVAADIAKLNGEFELLPRPVSAWFGDRGGARLTMDILGSKGDYKRFEKLSKYKG